MNNVQEQNEQCEQKDENQAAQGEWITVDTWNERADEVMQQWIKFLAAIRKSNVSTLFAVKDDADEFEKILKTLIEDVTEERQIMSAKIAYAEDLALFWYRAALQCIEPAYDMITALRREIQDHDQLFKNDQAMLNLELALVVKEWVSNEDARFKKVDATQECFETRWTAGPTYTEAFAMARCRPQPGWWLCDKCNYWNRKCDGYECHSVECDSLDNIGLDIQKKTLNRTDISNSDE